MSEVFAPSANADAGAFTASGSKTLAECSVTYTRV
jgi:hypothetical protein